MISALPMHTWTLCGRYQYRVSCWSLDKTHVLGIAADDGLGALRTEFCPTSMLVSRECTFAYSYTKQKKQKLDVP